MKKNNLWIFRLLTPLFLLVGILAKSQDSFLVAFPTTPPAITVCDSPQDLRVSLAALHPSTTGGDVTIQLAPGMEYVPASGSVVSSNNGLTITDNGGTPNAPVFKINNAGSNIAAGNNIVFTISRVAKCAAIAHLTGGGTFADKVTAVITGFPPAVLTTADYTVLYPVLSFSQPATQNGAQLNVNYDRTFTVTNGGNGCTKTIYVGIDHPASGAVTNSLTITHHNGVALGSPITLTATSTVGTTTYYTITTAMLPGGDLCNGESLQFKENYKLLKCDTTTGYTIGWGCDSAPTSWCTTVSGSGAVSMAAGTANLTSVTSRGTDFVDSCTPYTWNVSYKNTGTGDNVAAGMYNAKLRLGGGSAATMGNFGFDYHQLIDAKIGGISVPIVGGTALGIASMDLKDRFTTDPDGAGGLEDLDGDGFFDDIRAGNTVNVAITVKENCSLFADCNSENTNSKRGTYVDVQYTSMCSSTVQTTVLVTPSGYTPGGAQVSQLSNKSYAPANVYDGVAFNARFSVGYYEITNNLDTNDTRYSYEVTLPAGVALSAGGNVKWYNGQYTGSNSLGAAPTVTQVGSVLTVTSPNKNMGFFTLDLVYTCGTGGPISIPFKLKRLDNIVTGCVCNSVMFCDNAVIGNAVCAGPCPLGGASITFGKIERADNSLGWTDNTLGTLQSRALISDYDLSKALYLDDITVAANGRQSGAASNLFLKFSLNKKTGTDNKLTPKNIVASITRGATTVTGTLTTFTTNNTGTNAAQDIVWDLTSLAVQMPGGGLLTGDTFTTVASYNVSSNNLPTHDEQTGKELYFYNLDATNTEKRCNFLVPELYLVTATFINAQNGGNALSATSCQTMNIGSGTDILAHRFDAAGTIYQTEIRPGFLPKKYEFTVPSEYVLDHVTMTNAFSPSTATVDITSSLSQSGTTYTYNIPFNGYNIPVVNTYNVYFSVYVKPSCSTPATGQTYNSKVTYTPFYYHYRNNGSVADEVTNKNLALAYDTVTRPAISIVNLTGVVQASKPEEFVKFRVNSTGTSTAPYVWVAVPTDPDVTILSLKDLATNAVITGIPYTGGVWFKLSMAGIAAGSFKDYQIDFKYSACTTASFDILGGWNCADYPTSPTAYTCATPSTTFTFNPEPSTIQLTRITDPGAVVNMCDALAYQYNYISAGSGNTVDNKLLITLPAGVTFEAGTLLVQYPLNTGTWSAVTTTVSGNTTTLDLTTHPSYSTVTGLSGTLNDGGNANARQIGIKFVVRTDCTFISRSNIKFEVKGKNTCGTASAGDGVVTSSPPINIAGTDVNYVVGTTVTSPTGFDNCVAAPVLNITQTVITATVPTAAGGEIRVYLPVGYDYASMACTGTFCPTYLGSFTDASSLKYAKFSLPVGMDSGDFTNYQVTLAPNATGTTCGSFTIDIRTLENKGGIICTSTGQACPSVLVSTGDGTFSYTVAKPTYNIESLSGSFTGTTYSGSISVKNTSTLDQSSTNPIKVDFYCADASGVSTGQALGTYTMTSTLTAGSTATENFSFAGVNCSVTGRVVAIINTANNCICSASTASTLFCFKDGVIAGTALETKHGITSLGRAGADNSNWPMVRKGAWTALESKTKGFVVNRLTDAQMAALPAANLVVGMTIYNTTQNCLMINTDATAAGWKCYNNQACPD